MRDRERVALSASADFYDSTSVSPEGSRPVNGLDSTAEDDEGGYHRLSTTTTTRAFGDDLGANAGGVALSSTPAFLGPPDDSLLLLGGSDWVDHGNGGDDDDDGDHHDHHADHATLPTARDLTSSFESMRGRTGSPERPTARPPRAPALDGDETHAGDRDRRRSQRSRRRGGEEREGSRRSRSGRPRRSEVSFEAPANEVATNSAVWWCGGESNSVCCCCGLLLFLECQTPG